MSKQRIKLTKAGERRLREFRVGAGLVAYKCSNDSTSYFEFYTDSKNQMRFVGNGKLVGFEIEYDEDGFEISADAISKNEVVEPLKSKSELANVQTAITNREKDALTIHKQLEETRQQLADTQAKNARLTENNESLRMAIQETLKFFRGDNIGNVTTMRIFLEQFETIDAIMANQAVPIESEARKFADGQVVMVATHGIGASFFHKATIEDAILGKNFGGKRAYLYAVRYENSQKLRIDVGEHDIKPYAEAPASEVTLSAQEIAWLALYYIPMSNDFHVDELGIAIAPNCVIRMGETKSGLTRFQLVPEKRTDANIAAIQNHRKELLGE